MTTPAGPVAYVMTSLIIYDAGNVAVQGYGCVMNPDGSLVQMAGGWQVAVEVPLTYGMSGDDLRAAIGQAIATGYGTEAPSVVLLPPT